MTITQIPSSNQQPLTDLYLNFGNDLQVANTADFLLADGVTLSNQRILRRLLTGIKDYIWQTDYGAGLPAYIGEPFSEQTLANIESAIKSQIYLEDTVARYPIPVISLQAVSTGLFCQINYTYAPTNQPIVLTFNV